MMFEEIYQLISAKFPDLEIGQPEETANALIVKSESWLPVAEFIAATDELKFDSLHCITGVDNGPENNLEVRYNFFSMTHRHWLEVQIILERDQPSVPSVEKIWRTADWLERETYDMYGIVFEWHRDLRRILLEDDWEGWPLRKDYVEPQFYRDMPVPKDKSGWE